MGSRRFSRQDNGRFRRATLENTFGLSVEVCPACRRMSSHQAGSEPPKTCHACGAVLRPVSQCTSCDGRIVFLADVWTGGDGTAVCPDTSVAPFALHQPKDALAPPPHDREKVTPGSQLDDPALLGWLVVDCSCGSRYAVREGANEWDVLDEGQRRHVADAAAPDGEGSDLD